MNRYYNDCRMHRFFCTVYESEEYAAICIATPENAQDFLDMKMQEFKETLEDLTGEEDI